VDYQISKVGSSVCAAFRRDGRRLRRRPSDGGRFQSPEGENKLLVVNLKNSALALRLPSASLVRPRGAREVVIERRSRGSSRQSLLGVSGQRLQADDLERNKVTRQCTGIAPEAWRTSRGDGTALAYAYTQVPVSVKLSLERVTPKSAPPLP